MKNENTIRQEGNDATCFNKGKICSKPMTHVSVLFGFLRAALGLFQEIILKRVRAISMYLHIDDLYHMTGSNPARGRSADRQYFPSEWVLARAEEIDLAVYFNTNFCCSYHVCDSISQRFFYISGFPQT